MKILIVGGNRFVGQALAETLIEQKLDITIFNRKGTGPKGVTIIKGDRNQADDLKQIDFKAFDLVVDFCLFKPEQFLLFKNYILPETPYIFISSASVGREEWGAYGTEKEDCEKLIRKYFNKFTIIRPPYIDGQNSHRARTAQIINQIENSLPVTIAGDGNYMFNIIWVDDLVKFINTIITDQSYDNQTIDLSCDEQFTMNEYIQILAEFLDRGYVTAFDSKPFWAPANDLGVEPNELSHNFKPVGEKLENFYNWYKEFGIKKYGY